MNVTLNVTGPGPVWSSSKPGRRRGAYRPKPSSFAAFAEAVARRYGASVDRYILWNEPNISAWLAPQASCTRRGCTPVAPHLYRGLVRAAYPAIKAADPGAQVVIGALSPRGQRLRNADTVMRPLLFLRRFGCRSDRWARLTSGSCRRFKPATGDGFAIHPYSGRSAPERSHPNPDDVSLAQISNLTSTLDRLQRRRGIRSTTRRLGIYIDEYGYQTRPPDPVGGIRPHTQDVWLQRAAYMAWRHPRVKLFTQYLWRDEPRSGGNYSGWQSGLRYISGRAKPSLAHFDTPFALDTTPQPAVGPGAARRAAYRDGRAPPVRRRLAKARRRHHRFPRVLDAEGAVQGHDRVPLPRRRAGERDAQSLSSRKTSRSRRRIVHERCWWRSQVGTGRSRCT